MPHRDKSEAGFSLLELLFVTVIIGVLSAIAVPGWLGFLERQKLRMASDQVYIALRSAQKEARFNKENWQLSLRDDGKNAEWIVHPEDTDPAKLSDWTTLDSAVKVDQETTIYQNNSSKIWKVEFNYKGHPNGQLGRITLSLRKNKNERRCMFVSTLIGAMRTGENHAKAKDGRYCY
jgi:prepilin-type N-terminal cleavage/methylation domain-containing protein